MIPFGLRAVIFQELESITTPFGVA